MLAASGLFGWINSTGLHFGHDEPGGDTGGAIETTVAKADLDCELPVDPGDLGCGALCQQSCPPGITGALPAALAGAVAVERASDACAAHFIETLDDAMPNNMTTRGRR